MPGERSRAVDVLVWSTGLQCWGTTDNPSPSALPRDEEALSASQGDLLHPTHRQDWASLSPAPAAACCWPDDLNSVALQELCPVLVCSVLATASSLNPWLVPVVPSSPTCSVLAPLLLPAWLTVPRACFHGNSTVRDHGEFPCLLDSPGNCQSEGENQELKRK